MIRVGLISDTHGCLDDTLLKALAPCTEIWHGGDFGANVVAGLQKHWPAERIRGVYGNIDGHDIRTQFPERLVFNCESVKIAMIHIGGYPGRYAPDVKNWLCIQQPQIFISGHSHILKIVRDPQIHNMLHINPGAAGISGFHKVRTLVRLSIDGDRIFDVQVVELPGKGDPT